MSILNEPAPWVGNTTQKLRRGGLNVRPNAPFYLTHHPRGWELVISEKGSDLREVAVSRFGDPPFLPGFPVRIQGKGEEE